MKRVMTGKMMIFAVLMVWVLTVSFLTGCSASKDSENKVKDLEFTVVGESDIPDELKQIISEKQASPFKLTYSDDQSLYIVVGHGQQETGGYSIAVNELYLTDNSIILDTELIGPKKGENAGAEASFPYIVIKTEFREEPVVFQ